MNTRRAFPLGFALCFLSGASRAADTTADNLVKNGDFANDTDGWTLRIPKKTEVFATLARNEAGEASVLIVNGGRRGHRRLLRHGACVNGAFQDFPASNA